MNSSEAVVKIEHRRAPHALYLAIGVAIVIVLSVGIGFALYELAMIERNVNKSAAASAETVRLRAAAVQKFFKDMYSPSCEKPE